VRAVEHLLERLEVLTQLIELGAIGASVICVISILVELHWFVLLQGRHYSLPYLIEPSH